MYEEVTVYLAVNEGLQTDLSLHKTPICVLYITTAFSSHLSLHLEGAYCTIVQPAFLILLVTFLRRREKVLESQEQTEEVDRREFSMASHKRRCGTSEHEEVIEPFPEYQDLCQHPQEVNQQNAWMELPIDPNLPQKLSAQNNVGIPPNSSIWKPTTAVGEILLGEWRTYPEPRIQLPNVFITASIADDGALFFHFRDCNLK